MCGRYAFVPGKDFFEIFEIENTDFKLDRNENASPGQMLPVVTMNSPKKVIKMKWGLIPYWAKDAKIAFKTINARSEEIGSKPAFRGSFKNKRCLIPASGFYEWLRDGKTKVPYQFWLKDRKVFAFAGVYDIWVNPEGYEVKTYSILTTKANGVVGKVHDRMPVILTREDEEIWADNSTFDPVKLAKLFRPYEDDEIASRCSQ